MAFIEEGPDVDMDDLMQAWDDVAFWENAVSEAENTLEIYQAVVCKAATSEEYWVNNKPPTSAYLEKVVSLIGVSDKSRDTLKERFLTMFDARKELTMAKGKLDVLHEKIRVWQTRSANARKVLSVE